MDAFDHVTTLAPGSVFAREFRVERPLASGGMGAVYLVEQVQTGYERALKVMHPYLVRDPKLRQRFLQEARVGARIQSDHIVQVVAAGVDEATKMPWLAMELLRGQDLADFVHDKGPLPPSAVAAIFEQLCHALGAAHDIGVVHRDLKPENIFLAVSRSSGLPFMVKVLDFGIAKLVAEGRSLTTTPLGTPLWMAPEQTEPGRPIMPATDVWALALIAFRLLTGRHYWKGATDESASPVMLLREVVLDPIVPASVRADEAGVRELLPPGFDEWFARCMEREPQSRFADARAAGNALQPLLAQGGVGLDAGGLSTRMTPSDALAKTIPVTPLAPSGGRTQPIPSDTREEAGMSTRSSNEDQPGTPDPDDDVEPPPRPSGTRSSGGMPIVLIAGAGVAVLMLAAFFGFQRMRESVRDEAVRAVNSVEDGRRQEQEKEELKRKISERRAGLDRMVGRMVPLPPGGLEMGANEDFVNEQPVHHVDVARVEIDELEVSVASFQLCVGAGKCAAPGAGPQCNWDKPERRNHPINCVDWNQANDFCTWAAKRLPTESEWEYAARAPDGRRFSWGAAAPDNQPCWRRGGVDGGPGEGTCACSEAAGDITPFQVKDLGGNVREWTSDGYCPYSRPACDSTTKVIRGGAWTDQDAAGMRAALRNAKPVDYKSESVGFRCVRSVL